MAALYAETPARTRVPADASACRNDRDHEYSQADEHGPRDGARLTATATVWCGITIPVLLAARVTPSMPPAAATPVLPLGDSVDLLTKRREVFVQFVRPGRPPVSILE